VQAIFTGDYFPTRGLPEKVVRFHDRSLDGGTHILDLYKGSGEAKKALAAASASLAAIVASAERGAPFDTLIAEDNPEGNRLVQTAISQLLLFSFALQALHS
jgi:uncharacterized iron-regulated protein